MTNSINSTFDILTVMGDQLRDARAFAHILNERLIAAAPQGDESDRLLVLSGELNSRLDALKQTYAKLMELRQS